MTKFGQLKGTVILAGGTGFIGSAVNKALSQLGWNVTVVSRKLAQNRMTWAQIATDGLPPNTKVVINCAGKNIFDMKKSWDDDFKQEVWSSRVDTTSCLANAIDNAEEKPNVFITFSGVGHYKPSETVEYTEDSPGGNFDFFSNLTAEWEKSSQLSNSPHVRVVNLRSGVVLGRAGGVIKGMYWPFYFGLGGRVGSKITYFPWIHINDIVGMIMFSIDNEKVNGPLNGVAPQIITNQEFAKAFARALRRPAIFPIPNFILNRILSEERANLMIEAPRVLPKKALDLGFEYDYPDIDSACKECSKVEYLLDEQFN